MVDVLQPLVPTTVLARALALALLALGVLTTASAAQVVEAPFNAAYAFADVGAPPGVPAPLGGLTTKTGDPDVLVIGGRPIREPVAWHGPFVMNTRAEVLQAMDDYQAGRLGTVPASSLLA